MAEEINLGDKGPQSVVYVPLQLNNARQGNGFLAGNPNFVTVNSSTIPGIEACLPALPSLSPEAQYPKSARNQ